MNAYIKVKYDKAPLFVDPDKLRLVTCTSLPYHRSEFFYIFPVFQFSFTLTWSSEVYSESLIGVVMLYCGFEFETQT